MFDESNPKTILPLPAEMQLRYRFRRDQRKSKAESTVRKTCSRAKTMFEAAVRMRLLEESPFADMKKLAIRSAKKFTVTREMADKVLEACVDNQWKLIFALCRFGGLRCTSEVLRLRWGDVNWQLGRITIHSSKTEHHDGGGVRVMPLFPELRPHLQAVLDELLEKFDPKAQRLSEQPVITRYRKSNANLRTQLERTIKAAGLKPWPVLFNSLRATRVNELRDQFPDHVVNAWMGHSQKVAERHYLEPTDDHFAAATAARGVENCSAALQSGGERPDSSGQERTEETEFPEDLHESRETQSSEAPVGLEPVSPIAANCVGSDGGGTKSGTIGSETQRLAELWPELTSDERVRLFRYAEKLLASRVACGGPRNADHGR